MKENGYQRNNLVHQFDEETDLLVNELEEIEEEPELCLDLEKFKKHEAWSDSICTQFGPVAALSFAVGSDVILDCTIEELSELSSKPAGTHIGELLDSRLQNFLPDQFLMNYDYDFIYCLKATVEQLRTAAKFGMELVAHSVIQELAIYMIAEASKEIVEDMLEDEIEDFEELNISSEWVFDLFKDMDVVTFLYSGMYLTSEHGYHFDNWCKAQFFVNHKLPESTERQED